MLAGEPVFRADGRTQRIDLTGLFEPGGIEFNEQATLVITLDPPLPPEEALNVVEIPAASSAVAFSSATWWT